MRPLCARCQTEMGCIKNEVLVIGPVTIPRYGDLYECPGCKARIVTGFGQPIIEENIRIEERWTFENHVDPRPQPHIHEANYDGDKLTDECGKCGLDLRSNVHIRGV